MLGVEVLAAEAPLDALQFGPGRVLDVVLQIHDREAAHVLLSLWASAASGAVDQEWGGVFAAALAGGGASLSANPPPAETSRSTSPKMTPVKRSLNPARKAMA